MHATFYLFNHIYVVILLKMQQIEILLIIVTDTSSYQLTVADKDYDNILSVTMLSMNLMTFVLSFTFNCK